MERVRLTPPGEKRARGGRARLYVRWMPHLGAEAVALYELLRILPDIGQDSRSEEHTSELQSRQYLVCRLLLEKKKKTTNTNKLTYKPITVKLYNHESIIRAVN